MYKVGSEMFQFCFAIRKITFYVRVDCIMNAQRSDCSRT